MSVLSIIKEATDGVVNISPEKLFQRFTTEAVETIAGKRRPNLDFELTRIDLVDLANANFDLNIPLVKLVEKMTEATDKKKVSAALAVNEAVEDFIEFKKRGGDFIRDLNHNDIISRYIYYVVNDDIDYLPSCCTEEFMEFLNGKEIVLREFIAFIIATYELPIALALLYCLDVLLNK